MAKLTKCGRMRALFSSGTHRNTMANAALAMPPNAEHSMICRSSGTDVSFVGLRRELILARSRRPAAAAQVSQMSAAMRPHCPPRR